MNNLPPAYTEKSALIRSERSARRPPSSIQSSGCNHQGSASGGGWAGNIHTRRTPGSSPGRDWGSRSSSRNILLQFCSVAGFFCFLIFSGLLSIGLFVKLRPHADAPYVRRVAIIGAGPAGASAAYNIRKFTRERGILVDITIYEKDSHIGGRSTCQIRLSDDNEFDTVQIAARGFHAVNKNLVDAVNHLGLTPVMLDGREDTDLSGRSGDRWGVFDGNSIVYRQAHPTNFLTGWWWSFKLFFFYGHSPRNTQNTVKATRAKFNRIHSPRFFPFTSLTAVVKDLELDEELSSTGTQLLSSHGVSMGFQKDLVNSWTRRDFGQNLGTMSGLAAMTAPDDGGDMTVKGGHWGLFQSMVEYSKAELKLDTSAFGLRRMDWGGWVLASQPTEGESDPEDGEYREFDTVILAAPYQFAKLDIKGEPLENVPEEREYTELHVTLFKSPRKLSGGYFHHKGEVPETMLTTLRGNEFESLNGRTGVDGVGAVGFYEIKSVKRIDRVDLMGVVIEEWLYKIVSPARMEDATIKAMLGAGGEEDGIITWIYRHEWPAAMPYVYPLTQTTPLPPLKLSPNLYYTSSIESLGSDMEMSSLMGANVAALVVDEWWAEGKRGKRPDRNFDEPHAGNSESGKHSASLWPETAYSWGRGVYEGIWNDELYEPEQEEVAMQEEVEVQEVEVQAEQAQEAE